MASIREVHPKMVFAYQPKACPVGMPTTMTRV
jgi:hypothetical protein